MHQLNQTSATPRHDERVANKEKLLKLMLAAKRKQRHASRTIAARGQTEGGVPLSHAQERLWFLDQLGLVKAAYNMPTARRLLGELDAAALERSLTELMRRHESLRTRFEAVAGKPVQVVDPPRAMTLELHDFSACESGDKGRQAQLMADMEAQRPFDLTRGPLLRASLLKLADSEHVLLLTLHHIISDGWSIAILNREIGALYAAFSRGSPSSLPELPIQYADYAIWQRNWLTGRVLDDHMQYWRERLSGAPPQLELPTDRVRPAIETFKGSILTFAMPARLRDGLKDLARREGVTLFMLSLAAYQVLLSRWSGQLDVVVGSPTAGRTHAQTEGLIGSFVNMLALRTDLSGNPTFRELIQRVREVTLGAYAHQDLPFEKLVMDLRPDRDLSRQSIIQVTLVLQNFPKQELDLPGLTWTSIVPKHVTTRFDLTLHLSETADGLRGQFDYATDLFDERTIEQLSVQFHTLLEGILVDADGRVQNLPLLDANERDRLLVRWNQSAAVYRRDKYVHELVAEQATRTPDAVALLQGNRQLTYGELEERSNRLAWHLVELGVEPDVVVGLYLERSLELVIGLLAILKAGGAYLPLDPKQPRERIELILKDSRASLLLTGASTANRLCEYSGGSVRIDADSADGWRRRSGVLKREVAAHSAVYVIYTSGSTGTPKGVVVEHGGLLNYVQWALRCYAPTWGDAIPVSSPLAFDATGTSLYCALLSGRTALLLTESEELEELEKTLLQPGRCSLIKVSPAHLQALGPRLQSAPPRLTVGTIVVGGEELPAATVQLWRSFWPEARIVNQYGPTETVVACCAHEVPAAGVAGGSVPIGRPVWNTQVYVLDSLLQPVPIGVPGELYIAGLQVSRGYLHRSELSAERFIANPFTSDGSRMYRSGDQVRYLANGSLVFIGRIDRQVKIRGYRIELGEVEAVLSEHPAIKQVAVLAREDVPGDKRLVAYVAVKKNLSEDPAAMLREHVKGRLPEYMVPSVWMVLDSLPLTSNGKLNRRALPAPESRGTEHGAYIAPRDELEQTLTDIWRQLLRVDRISVSDNLFERGAHSLLVLQALFKISKETGHALKVADVYSSLTIREMAARIRGSEVEDEFVDLATEAVLGSEIVAVPRIAADTTDGILLTGATGFVGRFLLAQLLEDSGATIYCLVRAATQQQASLRLKAVLAKWHLWCDEWETRVVAIPGDLRLPRLGIDELTYRFLCRNVDSIYHCATSMNHLESYAVSKLANVAAATELLKIATDERLKIVNYVSTLSIFRAHAGDPFRVVNEDSAIDHERHRKSSGYVASKWVGEKMFMIAGSRGIPCNLFRLGLVWADSQQGRYDELQREYRILKSCLLSGFGIANYAYESSPIPVDYAARAIVALAQAHQQGVGIFHISSPSQRVDAVFERCNSRLDMPLELVPMFDWIKEIKSLHHQGTSLPVVPLIEFAFSMDESEFLEQQRRSRAERVRMECTKTHRALENAGIVLPVLDDELLGLSLESMSSHDEEVHDLTIRTAGAVSTRKRSGARFRD